MEAEKVLISIEAGMEMLRKLDVFADTGADAGRNEVQKGLHKIRLAVERKAARGRTLGDELE